MDSAVAQRVAVGDRLICGCPRLASNGGSLQAATKPGAGWIILEHHGRSITWHNGRTGGFSSWIGLDRAAGTGVVVLAAARRSVDRQGFQCLEEFTSPEQ